MDDRERYEQGMKERRSVLGDAHVDRALEQFKRLQSDISGLHHALSMG